MRSARSLAALALLTLFWGLNWPVMKFSLRELTPLYFRAITMSGGVLLLVCWYRLQGASLTMPARDLPRVILLAVPNVLGWHALSIFGIQELASGRAAILGFTMPIWTVVLGVTFFREKMSARYWVGIACSAAAVALLLSHELSAMAGRPVGTAWMLGAACAWALGTLLLRRVTLAMSTEALTVWMIASVVPVFWALALLLEPPPSWSFSPWMWVALAYGFAINYGVAQIIWFSIARNLPPVASALSIMLIPIVGLGSAMWMIDERPHAEDYLAAALIIAALAVVLLGKRR
jgi:drug/metabolite transporter (DMT)-like permease